MTSYTRQFLLLTGKSLLSAPNRVRITEQAFCRIKLLGINSILPTKRGTRGGLRSKAIAHETTETEKKQIPLANKSLLKVALLNAHSVCNKPITLCEYIKDRNLDIFAITETWLTNDNDPAISNLLPHGFSMQHVHRTTRAGGVAIVHKDNLQLLASECQDYQSFEYVERKFSCRSASYNLVSLYRPPSLPFTQFLEDFTLYLESLLISKPRLIICGDFNIHMNKPDNPDTARFNQLLESSGLKQHVTGPTHKLGNTLDLLLTREPEEIFNINIVNDHISDHMTVFFDIELSKPTCPTKEIQYRKIKAIDINKFKSDIIESGLPNLKGDTDTLVESYNHVLGNLLDKHAPLKKRVITIHPDGEWMNDEIKNVRREKRKAERIMRKTGLEVHKQIYIELRNKLNGMICSAKRNYIQQCISQSDNGHKALFKNVNNLLNKKKSTALPQHDSAEDLCNRMATFFSEKIKIIHEGLAELQTETIHLEPDQVFNATCLNDFDLVTEEEVNKIIKKAASKSCCLDPIPTQLVKECLDVLLPLITRIINQSFANAYVPKAFKLAAVTPILKKANLIAEILKNFRPISNLPFLSKVLEKVAAKQMLKHKDTHSLREKMQSAYREFHSTETALIKICNDLLLSLDKKQCVFMVMLDLSAAFDTVNHQKLLDRLHTTFGIRGNAHKWVESYLKGRSQFVTIKGARSKTQQKTCDVPQGSILGPNLYEDYTAVPVGNIFRRNEILFHIYADDTQAYLPFEINTEKMSLERLENCLQEIRQWMAQNWLKLNDSKTEFIVFGSQANLDVLKTTSVTLGSENINISDCAKSIGATLDCHLNMNKQVVTTCRSAWYHLHQISKIRKFLTVDQTKSLVHAYVTSRLDQNNSLLLGLPKKLILRLQNIQNAAARLIMGVKKRDHITPSLIKLHWLPIERRIVFKVLLLIYKSLHGKGPKYLQDMLKPYNPPRDLRSASKNLLCVPDCHYMDTRKRAFSIRGPMEWNNLPQDLKSCSSVDSFKRALKTHLFKLSYM